MSYYTLDGVGPVDNRPPTDKLRQLVKEANKNKFVTHDMQHVVGMNIVLKLQLLNYYGLGVMIF